MQTQTAPNPHTFFAPLEAETRPVVDTATAAHYLLRRPQTLRGWACNDGSGPLRPLRVHGRLMWRVAEIRALLGESSTGHAGQGMQATASAASAKPSN